MGKFKDLIVWNKAYELAMDIYRISKNFPMDEKFALTNQIRRSSRSVCSNIAEAYRRRKYRNHFLSKLNDCESENCETEVWLLFARDCCYISNEQFHMLFQRNDEVGKLLRFMITHPEKFM